MKRFNKVTTLKRLKNKNNYKTKRNTIVLSIVILVLGIICFTFARFEYSNTYSLINGTVNNSRKIVPYITRLAKTSSDLEYDGIDTLPTYGTDDNNIRYVGANPNNYMYFNCTTNVQSQMNESTCELWRIIGIFNNVEDENGNTGSGVKIIRDKDVESRSWDNSPSSVNDGNGINQWGESTYVNGLLYEGADLMLQLNFDYLGITGPDVSINNKKNILPRFLSEGQIANPISNYALNETYINMIQPVKWYTGATVLVTESDIEEHNEEHAMTNQLYYSERDGNLGKLCAAGDDCNDTVDRTATWIGKVALINASDAGYATKGDQNFNKNSCLEIPMTEWDSQKIECLNNSWLFSKSYSMWTLDAFTLSNSASTVLAVGTSGLLDYSAAWNLSDVYPTLFLKNSLEIISGDGSKTSPFIVGNLNNNS